MSTSISLELVPRSEASLIADAMLVAAYPAVTHINIPDIDKFALRSTDAVRLLRERFGNRFTYVPQHDHRRLQPLDDPRPAVRHAGGQVRRAEVRLDRQHGA